MNNKFEEFKNLLLNTFSLLLLLVVVIISTAGAMSLTPRTPSELSSNAKAEVKGVSTFDTLAIKYEEFIGIANGMDIINYSRKDGGYLSRVIIGETNAKSLDQGIVKIINNSQTPKKFKVIFRADPQSLQNYTFNLALDNTVIPMQLNEFGYIETTFFIEPLSSEIVGINLIPYMGYVQNIGIEMEVEEL